MPGTLEKRSTQHGGETGFGLGKAPSQLGSTSPCHFLTQLPLLVSPDFSAWAHSVQVPSHSPPSPHQQQLTLTITRTCWPRSVDVHLIHATCDRLWLSRLPSWCSCRHTRVLFEAGLAVTEIRTDYIHLGHRPSLSRCSLLPGFFCGLLRGPACGLSPHPSSFFTKQTG